MTSSTLDDGWDDDDDIDISQEDDNLELDGGGSGRGGGDTDATDVDDDNLADADGWGDDDLFFGEDDEDDEDDNNVAATTATNVETTNTNTQPNTNMALSSSWPTPPLPDATTATAHAAPPHATSDFLFTTAISEPASPPPNAGGCDDDNGVDDLNFDDSWDEDDNDDDDAVVSSKVDEPDILPPLGDDSQQQQQRVINSLQQELERYVASLDHILSSLNAVLDYEYNTQQKAQELIEYYQSRPALSEYTRSKELQRMNYQIVLPYGDGVETDKAQILANNLLPDESLVARAANQSLLADLLQVITGNDLIVRPQYLAMCVAHYCKFTVHLEEYDNVVDCQARLYLSLPTETQRLDIAEIFVSVVFAPDQGTIQYRVQKIDVLLKDLSLLANVAHFLAMMDVGHLDEFIGRQEQNQNAFRDAFLENSQKLLTQSTKGMKSALQQMDSVMNIKAKLKTISSFVPDTDVIAAAEEEALAFAQARHLEMEQRQKQGTLYPGPNHSTSFPRPPPPPPPQTPPPQSFQSSFEQQQVDDASRPKSILGGLFRSGLKTLANTVILSDEDPAIYDVPPESTLNSQGPPHAGLTLYRKEHEKRTESHPKRPPPGPSMHPPVPLPHHQQQQRRQQHPNETLMNLTVSGEAPKESEKKNFGLQGTASRSDETAAPAPADMVDDGWDDDGIMDGWNDDESAIDTQILSTGNSPPKIAEAESDRMSASSPHQAGETVVVMEEPAVAQGKTLVIEMSYNEVDDIIETRKRWRNPRPHRPYVVDFVNE